MKNFAIVLIFMTFLTFSIAAQEVKSLICIETEIGNIVVELYEDKAPVTASNFIKYIDLGHFKNAEFYRTVTLDNQPDNDIKIEVIQGGIWDIKRPDIEPILHETTEMSGIKHLDGTISMARSDTGTATSEFFICVNNQPSLDFGGLRNPDGQGFAAFGRVINGMDIVRKIHKSDSEGQQLEPRIRIKDITKVVVGRELEHK